MSCYSHPHHQQGNRREADLNFFCINFLELNKMFQDDEDFYTLDEASQLTGLNPSSLRGYAISEKIESEHTSEGFIFKKRVIEQYLEQTAHISQSPKKFDLKYGPGSYKKFMTMLSDPGFTLLDIANTFEM